jgi:lysozyme
MSDIPQAAIDLIKRCEGCRLTAYRDSGGVLTIGFGRAYNVKAGQAITQAEADAMLAYDLQLFARGVDRLVDVPLTENQRAALISFAFNCGLSAFARSTLLVRLNAGDYAAVPAELAKWVNDGGKRIPGLVNRRAAEAELWSR